jgi:hypothetical protein
MWRASLTFVFCSLLGAQQASFEGVVSHSATKQPMSGVHVRLMALGFSGPAYGAISDQAGHFSIGGLKPGTYALIPEYRGFVYIQPKQGTMYFPEVTLKAGEHIADFKLEMTPRAVIAGRVLDEFGDPLQYSLVEAELASKATVSSGLAGVFGRYQTDDRGMFRISGAPGKYYVKASPGEQMPDGPPEIRTDGTAAGEYGPTWYPSAIAKEAAATVDARPGSDVYVEIRMAHANRQRGPSITGTVHGLPDGNSGASVTLRFGESRDVVVSSTTRSTTPDGKFSFSRLEPGFYRVSAADFAGSTQLQSEPVELKLANDQALVELQLTPLGELTGTLEIVEDPPRNAPTPEKRTVSLDDTEYFGNLPMLSGEVDRNGAFRLAAVPRDRVKVRLDPWPENAYIKSLELDGARVAGAKLDLSHVTRGSRLKIVVSRNGAQISGSVLDKDGDKLLNRIAYVLLVDDPAKVHGPFDPDYMTSVTPEGQYTFKGVRPGKYRLVAIDALHTASNEKPEILKTLAGKAEEFEIKEGARITKDLKVAVQE